MRLDCLSVELHRHAISEEHVDSFVRKTNKEYLSNPNYRYVQINLQENFAKAFLVSLYTSSLRRSIPEALHPTYLLSKQNMEYVREPLGMNNKHIGFVYLLDQQLRVRWAGGGLATPAEAESLKVCAKVLLDRMKSK
ncbi:ATPase assembly factor ATP10 [Phellopilus nigrolimitatus]|nr:ATPase assembly factor ATP10 [Phellopilus nigrolimitatus]